MWYRKWKRGPKIIGVHIWKSAGCVSDAPVYWFWKVRSVGWNGVLRVVLSASGLPFCSLQERSHQGWAGFTAQLGRMGIGGPSRSGAKGDCTASVRNIGASLGGTRSDLFASDAATKTRSDSGNLGLSSVGFSLGLSRVRPRTRPENIGATSEYFGVLRITLL